MQNRKIKMISFDGPDGLGKTTQLNLLKTSLVQNSVAVHSTRLLGGDGEDDYQLALRKVLLHSKFPKDSVELEEQLFALTDLEGIKIAKEFLEAQKGLVLKDRAIASHVAYAYAKNMSFDKIERCHSEVIRMEKELNSKHGVLNLLFIPDSVDWLLERISERNKASGTEIVDRLENAATQERVIECLSILPSMKIVEGLSFETILVSKNDNIQDVAAKVNYVIGKYSLDI